MKNFFRKEDAMIRWITKTSRSIHFIVNASDHPNALAKRLAVREEHLERATNLKKNGFILLGGATVRNGQMDGSFLLVNAESKAQVEEYINTDVYHLEKVWKTIEIKEFKMAAISPFLAKGSQ